MFFSLKSPSSNLPFLSFESKPPKSPKRSPLPLLYYPSMKPFVVRAHVSHQISVSSLVQLDLKVSCCNTNFVESLEGVLRIIY
ncbi:hypothetical protein V6Z12_D09G008900 [Gossypium hirsutum]